MRFRFSIRDLLWLAVLAALAVGWWLDHRRTSADAASKIASYQLKIKELDQMLLTLNARESRRSLLSQQEPDPPKNGMPIIRPRQRAKPIPNAVDERRLTSPVGKQFKKTISISQFRAPQMWEIIARLEWASPVIAGLAIAAVLIVRNFRRQNSGDSNTAVYAKSATESDTGRAW